MGKTSYYRCRKTGAVWKREPAIRGFHRWRRFPHPLPRAPRQHSTGLELDAPDFLDLDLLDAVDEVLCPDTNVKEFKARCRVPLYPGRWNVWAIAVRLREGMTEESIRSDIEALFGRGIASRTGVRTDPWFRERGRATNLSIGFFWPGEDTPHPEGEIVDVDALAAAQERAATEYQGSPGATIAADASEHCPDVEMSAPITVVMVSFVYRGDSTTMPWPVTRRLNAPIGNPLLPFGEATLLDIWCPDNPDYAVLEVFDAPRVKAVPGDPDGPGIPWKEYLDSFLRSVSEAPSRSIDAAKWVGIGAVVLGLGWLASQFSGRRR